MIKRTWVALDIQPPLDGEWVNLVNDDTNEREYDVLYRESCMGAFKYGNEGHIVDIELSDFTHWMETIPAPCNEVFEDE